jgi:acetyl-CoA synthetase
MGYEPIRKTSPALTPNLASYTDARQSFRWDSARTLLAGLPGGSINIAFEAVDRHAAGKNADKVAIRWLGEESRRDITYRELSELSSQFANVLATLGVQRGERVFLLCERIPELYVAVLGALKAGSVSCALFSAFGPDPIATRMELGDARVLVTTEDQLGKIEKIRDRLPGLKHILVAGPIESPQELPSGVKILDQLMQNASRSFATVHTSPEDMALLHFTSGTTGKPKGAVHVHGAVQAHAMTGKLVLDLHDSDIYWCTADPGWVTGISYGIVAPLVNGVTMIVDQADFDLERWYEIVQNEKVTVWYTAPTAIRMMIKAGEAFAKQYSFPDLRLIFSVGEPLNAEAVVWGMKAFGLPIHDTWWQTETGAIMIANFASEEVRPGSMGLAVPGIEVAIARRTEEGINLIEDADEEGEIAIRTGWPSMFRAYLNEEARYAKSFAGGYYLTGDLAKRDKDGYFWFVGRSDDVIKSSGHLIGPFEVESAMMEHPAVAEAGVIGKPDEVAGQLVKAFISLRNGYLPTPELKEDIYGFGRKRLGAVAPREIEFLETLPKTRSGKIMRRLLKARELGLPEGDTSTLESSK